MRRRTFMAAAGSSAVAALAGCISEEEAKESGFATNQSDTDARGTLVDESPVFDRVWEETPDITSHWGVELASHDVDPRSDVTVRAESIAAVSASGNDSYWANDGEQEPVRVSPVNDHYWFAAKEGGTWTIAVRGSAVIDGQSVVVVHGMDVRKANGVAQVLDVWTDRYVEGESA